MKLQWSLRIRARRGCAVRCHLLLIGLIAGATSASATDLSVYTGYRTADDLEDKDSGKTIDFGEGESFGAILTVPKDQQSEFELLYSRQATNFSGAGSVVDGKDIDIEYWHIGGTYLLPREGATPYVSGGLGATHFSPDDLSSETKFSFSVGGGAKIPLGQRLALRLEARAFVTAVDNNGGMFCGSGQCRIVTTGSWLTQVEALAGVTLKFR